MQKTEYSLKKILAYIGIIFISVLLAGFFVGTEILNSLLSSGKDPYTIVTIDGKKIHRFDFKDYAKLYSNENLDEKKTDQLLNQYISMLLINKKFSDDGYFITKNKLVSYIKKIFTDPKTGKYDPARFKYFKSHTANYEDLFTKIILNEAFRTHLSMGLAVSDNELNDEFIIQNSKLQFKYSFISNSELKNNNLNKIKANKSEIEKKLANIKDKKDLKKERLKIRKEIENKNFITFKSMLISQINDIATKNGSFSSSSILLKGKIKFSNKFNLGEDAKEKTKKGKSLYPITSSDIYTNSIFNLKIGTSSKAIVVSNGIYIFTPTIKNITQKKPSKIEKKQLYAQLEYYKFRILDYQLTSSLWEKSKIVKNLKN